jgi:hypothetical protein
MDKPNPYHSNFTFTSGSLPLNSGYQSFTYFYKSINYLMKLFNKEWKIAFKIMIQQSSSSYLIKTNAMQHLQTKFIEL